MRISIAQASKLLKLDRGATLKRSEINKALRDDLISRGAIRLQKSGSGYRIAADSVRLRAVLENQYSIRNLNAYVLLQDGTRCSRAEVTQATGNSKALPVTPMKGLYLSILGDAEIFIDGRLSTPQPGTALFVPANRLQALSINPLRILGVENVEAFLYAERLRLPLPSSTVTVLRWNWGEEWRAWIGNHRPKFLYAGDYDWAGVSIFENEVLSISPEADFLVPHNLREKLQNGNSVLFQAQEAKFERYLPLSTKGAMIYKAVRECRKSLEQESLIDL